MDPPEIPSGKETGSDGRQLQRSRPAALGVLSKTPIAPKLPPSIFARVHDDPPDFCSTVQPSTVADSTSHLTSEVINPGISSSEPLTLMRERGGKALEKKKWPLMDDLRRRSEILDELPEHFKGFDPSSRSSSQAPFFPAPVMLGSSACMSRSSMTNMDYVFQAYGEMRLCIAGLVPNITMVYDPEDVLPECLDCIAFCSLFPKGYEIEDDELVQLWMGAGLIKKEPIQYIAIGYMKALHDFGDGFISFSREDPHVGSKWYKVNNSSNLEAAVDASRISLVLVGNYSNDPVHILSTARTKKAPVHASFRDLPSNLDFVSKFTPIKTLLLLRGHGSSHIDHIPYGFFMSLVLLRALDLSGTRVLELPSSIGDAKCLRYLNLSETLIKRLPEAISYVRNLQTLKLKNCPQLAQLPKAMRRVTSLRHLNLGTLCHLYSMPSGIGALTNLYTLSNFVVGQRFGCSIRELKNMNKLGGRICLSRLENIGSVDEAKEANLCFKQDITKLELRWTDDLEWESIEDDDLQEVIEHLQPSIKLQELRVLCYGGSKLPSWIGKPHFYKLKSITLFKCVNWQFLPFLGQLPSLVSLSLIELVRVKVFDLHFCIETAALEDNFVAFPKLEKLEMKSMLSLEEWGEEEKVDHLPSLTKLVIKDCPKLASLCRLSRIHRLKYLEINHCGNLSSLLEGGLPDSIETFVIDNCPLLSLNCSGLLEDNEQLHKTEDSSGLLIYQRNGCKQGSLPQQQTQEFH